LTAIADSLARIADHIAPEPDSIVGTPYIAERLGCTTTWVSEMIRDGRIPTSCIGIGTGNGKPWKFHRDKIDAWLASR
jgi:excisionase family DNA binding protein